MSASVQREEPAPPAPRGLPVGRTLGEYLPSPMALFLLGMGIYLLYNASRVFDPDRDAASQPRLSVENMKELFSATKREVAPDGRVFLGYGFKDSRELSDFFASPGVEAWVADGRLWLRSRVQGCFALSARFRDTQIQAMAAGPSTDISLCYLKGPEGHGYQTDALRGRAALVAAHAEGKKTLALAEPSRAKTLGWPPYHRHVELRRLGYRVEFWMDGGLAIAVDNRALRAGFPGIALEAGSLVCVDSLTVSGYLDPAWAAN